MNLETSVEALEGVGEVKAKKLEKLNIFTIKDLLNHYPRSHEDRTQIYAIEEAPDGEKVCIRATLTAPPTFKELRQGLDVVNVKATDNRTQVNIGIFNQRQCMKIFHPGQEYMFFGTMTQNQYGYNFSASIFEQIGKTFLTARYVPNYHLTTGISHQMLRGMILEALEKCGNLLTETLPDYLAQEYESVEFCIRNIHFPVQESDLEKAKARLAFEELFFLTLGLSLLKGRRTHSESHLIPKLPLSDFPLPFTPTGAQARVMEEIADHMASGRCMNRLVQGDVGSGKTAVAAYSGWLTIKGGGQVAMMAPTEVLAKQHHKTLTNLLTPLGINVGCLTASMTAKEKREVKTDLKTGEIDFVVGTHALLTGDISFHNLALVVVDEQHRFGVEQRAKLSDKAVIPPHVLVMSATPIPRTLALMVFGDLEVSIIDELPPNRTPIETFVVGENKRKSMYGFIQQQVEEGRQIYIICSTVEESETLSLKAVNTYVEELQNHIFPNLRVECIHGKRKPKEKDQIMQAFSLHEIDILVSTTVIEVGVDVPNANLILIEDADRFGLSTLHQLRGRVGRGEHKSYCLLMTHTTNPDTIHRLKTLASTTDGFIISEEDLKIRGPGDFFGSRQHGLPSLKLAELSGDMRTLSSAQSSALQLIDKDPTLELPEHKMLQEHVKNLFEGTMDIFN